MRQDVMPPLTNGVQYTLEIPCFYPLACRREKGSLGSLFLSSLKDFYGIALISVGFVITRSRCFPPHPNCSQVLIPVLRFCRQTAFSVVLTAKQTADHCRGTMTSEYRRHERNRAGCRTFVTAFFLPDCFADRQFRRKNRPDAFAYAPLCQTMPEGFCQTAVIGFGNVRADYFFRIQPCAGSHGGDQRNAARQHRFRQLKFRCESVDGIQNTIKMTGIQQRGNIAVQQIQRGQPEKL